MENLKGDLWELPMLALTVCNNLHLLKRKIKTFSSGSDGCMIRE